MNCPTAVTLALAAMFSAEASQHPKAATAEACKDLDSTRFVWYDSLALVTVHSDKQKKRAFNSDSAESLSFDRFGRVNSAADSRGGNSIFATIRRRAVAFSKVYSEYLALDSAIGGKLLMTFLINQKGDVVYLARVSSSTNCPRLDRGIFEQAKSLKFDEALGGNDTITYTFYLKSN